MRIPAVGERHRRMARMPAVLMRVAAAVLLAQGALAWAVLLGLLGPEGGFDALEPSIRNMLLVQALLCPVAMVGTWSVTHWGAVLWGLVSLSFLIALVLGLPHATLVASLLAAHGGGVLLWFLVDRRASRMETDEEVMFG